MAFGITDWCMKNKNKDELLSQQIIIIAIFMGWSCSAFGLSCKFQSLINIPSLKWLYYSYILIQLLQVSWNRRLTWPVAGAREIATCVISAN